VLKLLLLRHNKWIWPPTRWQNHKSTACCKNKPQVTRPFLATLVCCKYTSTSSNTPPSGYVNRGEAIQQTKWHNHNSNKSKKRTHVKHVWEPDIHRCKKPEALSPIQYDSARKPRIKEDGDLVRDRTTTIWGEIRRKRTTKPTNTAAVANNPDWGMVVSPTWNPSFPSPLQRLHLV